MCVHKRVVFSCFHSGWGPVARPCYVERAFQAGEIDAGCAVMRAHAFHTVRVGRACRRCAAGRRRTAETLARLRSCLGRLRRDMDRRRGVAGPAAAEDAAPADGERRGGRPEGQAPGLAVE